MTSADVIGSCQVNSSTTTNVSHISHQFLVIYGSKNHEYSLEKKLQSHLVHLHPTTNLGWVHASQNVDTCKGCKSSEGLPTVGANCGEVGFIFPLISGIWDW